MGPYGLEIAETNGMARLRSAKLLLLVSLFACAADERRDARVADLRADTNRDGEVRFDDDSDQNKIEWNASTGAIFLANIDDDGGRCQASTSDLTIASCNDAEDDVVNGEDDALDLARLKTRSWPGAPDDARGRITVETPNAAKLVRLFRKTGPGAADFEAITDATIFRAAELRSGIEVGIEGKDIVRDPATWDGYVDIKFTIESEEIESTDTVRMRVAPVLTYHHLLPAETIYVSDLNVDGNVRMRRDLAASCKAVGVDGPKLLEVNRDQWTQDFFEPGYASLPAPGGAQHVMRVNYRSANVFDPKKRETPLRPAGKVVFALRGKDMAGLQQYDIAHDPAMDSLNSTGNFETVPPYEKDGVAFPFGRLLRGSTPSWHPDRAFVTMLDAQLQQPPIEIDTSWLFVGHVDETLSFVKAPTARGWALLANDARLAKKMLEDAVSAGEGDAPMFVGKSWIDFKSGNETPAEISVTEVLANREVMAASAEAAVEVDAQIEILKREVGLTDDEIIPVPFLHATLGGKSIAYQPGTVNGIYVSDTRFAAPEPHGPIVRGKDVFKEALEKPLSDIGIAVDWVEDWDAYHRVLGEVHCGTNATRKIPEARWWESGR